MSTNTLDAVLPKIYTALKTVNREQIGFIPAVRKNSDLKRAAKGQTINFPIVPQGSLEDVNVSMTTPSTGGQTFTTDSLTLDFAKTYPIIWTGEEERGLKNGDNPQLTDIKTQQFMQAFRTLNNYIESEIASKAFIGSLAYGTAGTNPFNTAGDLSGFAGVKQLFRKNGSPMTDIKMVLNDDAMFKLEGIQTSLFKANEAGTDDLLRNGVLTRIQGFDLHSSQGLGSHTKGTGASYTTSGTALAEGTTSIPIITGTGTVLSGDVVTFTGDTTKYIVKTGVTEAGTIVISEPGLKVAIAAEATAMTIGSTYSLNSAFDTNAIILVTRPPEMPEGGDSATSSRIIVDPMSMIPYEVREYKGHGQNRIEISVVGGVKVTNPQNLFTLLG